MCRSARGIPAGISRRRVAEDLAGHATWLLQAAEAAGHAGKGWLRVAHALARLTTDARLCLSPGA